MAAPGKWISVTHLLYIYKIQFRMYKVLSIVNHVFSPVNLWLFSANSGTKLQSVRSMLLNREHMTLSHSPL